MDQTAPSDAAVDAWLGVTVPNPKAKAAPVAAAPAAAPSTNGINLDAPVTYNVEGQAPVTVASGREALAQGMPSDAAVDSYLSADPKRQALEDYAKQFPGWTPAAGAEHYYTPVDKGATVEQGNPGSYMLAPIKDAQGNIIVPRHPVTDAQAKRLFVMQEQKQLDPSAAPGSKGNPYAMDFGGNYPLNRGEWYIDPATGAVQQVGDADLYANHLKQVQETPEGRAALADARADVVRRSTLGGGFLGNVPRTNLEYEGSHGALLGFMPQASATIGYGRTAIGNLLTTAMGGTPRYSASDAAAAADVATRQEIERERVLHPVLAPAAEQAGALATSLTGLRAGGALLAPVREALGPSGAFLGGTAGTDMSGIGGLGLRALSRGTAGAIEGGTAGGLTSNLNPQNDLLGNIGTGAAFGSLLRGGGTLALAGGKATGRALLGAPSLGAEDANLLQKATDLGINLRAGQMSSNPFWRTMDSELGKMPLTGYAKSDAAQRVAFTRAAAATMGEDASGLTPEVMSRARDRIGASFDDVASRTSIRNRDDVLTGLAGVVHEASGVLPEGDLAPLNKQVENIASTFGPDGVMSGQSYQALTRKGGMLDRAMQSGDPNIRHYATEMRGVLDDALEANARPEDLAQLRTARLQWKNMRTLEDLAEKAGPDGAISPTLLKNEVRKSYKDYAYTGAGDIGDLGEIGQRFLKEPPNSGTAQRLGVRNMLTGGGMFAGGAAAASEMMHQPIPALIGGAGAATAFAAPPIAARLLNNPLTRSAFVDQAAPAWWSRYARPAIGATGGALVPIGAEEGNRLLALPRPQSDPLQQGR